MQPSEDPNVPEAGSVNPDSGEAEARLTAKTNQQDGKRADLLSWFDFFKRWMASLAIPVPVTLCAFVLAAFLLFPAIKGLLSESAIRQLNQKNHELEESSANLKTRNIHLERELSEREIRLRQRQQVHQGASDSSLYVSPLLFLEPKKPGTPDLISINFTDADQAILVFSLPERSELQDIEVSIYLESQLVWNQSIVVPKEKLFNQNLVTFLLTRSALRAGTYRLNVEGNTMGKRIGLNEFDLTIQG